jgi:hypothetical protein
LSGLVMRVGGVEQLARSFGSGKRHGMLILPIVHCISRLAGCGHNPQP